MGGDQKTQDELIYLYKNIIKFLEQSDIKLILFYGSLLGYHRDGTFINKDDDIDAIVDPRDFKKLKQFICANIKSPITLGINNDNIIQLYYENLGPFDIYLYNNRRNDILIPWDGNLLFDNVDIFPLKQIVYYEHNIFVPNNIENIIKITYGDKWYIPTNKSKYVWKDITKVKFAK